jgi:hypothetical protein
MTWLSRLRTSIRMTSPDGNVFDALWRGNPRSKDKKLGLFEYPRIRGADVQDLDVTAVTYPLTVYFEGQDHDIEAERFFKACSERGRWQIVHPVRGDLVLQLMSVTESITPVDDGNITRFETVWIEPLGEEIVPTAPELRGTIGQQIFTVNSVASDQLDENVSQDTAGEISAFESAVNKVIAGVTEFLGPLAALNAEINAQIASIKRGIDAVLAVVPLDILSLAGQIQELVQLPALAIRDVNARIEAYQNFAQGIFNITPDNPDLEGRNTVSVKEIALTAALGAVSGISSTGQLTTAVQAIGLIESNLELLDGIIENLDESQELFQTRTIDIQYFSQSLSFPATALMTAQTVAYLLRTSFDLSTEKRFTLKRPRVPIEITISEYGDLGANDTNLDLFIDTNGLKADEILLLPAGREVIVYI